MSMGLSAGAISLISAGAQVAAPLVGGLMQGDSAESAYGAQAAGAGQANQTLQANYDQTRKDFGQYMTTGGQANNALAYALGIGGSQGPTRQEMYDAALQNLDRQHRLQYGVGFNESGDSAGKQAALNRLSLDVDQRYAESQAAQPDKSADPRYGMLTKQFDAADLAKDIPYQSGLQFGLDEGAKGINNMAAATGKQLSGATLKALTRFGSDYGTTKAAGAADRYAQRQNQIYGMYSGTSNSGQQAAGTVSQAGQATANGVSGNQVGLGNARGASEIAQGNAMSGALSGAVSGYQNNRLVDSLTRGASGFRTPGINPSEPYPGYNASIGL